ncbi:nitroreductase family protein [Marinigracilibium pacificum]|uniref:Nitroreductase family protein n=1 Tax=Marinigracilibium pacificum TaxID=2729599 RepID=A0A848J3W7_9BACT|nr:nitroreductase family protein [Marinigracilibium pacificum]NMM50411.1 nitroreductase family protein [Marinigracilibium pacificum]
METTELINVSQHTDKLAETDQPVHDLIKSRWSTRSFREEKISDEKLRLLFEAASWAASSMNEQPWRYIYAHKGSSSFDKMAECLMEGNYKWAKDSAILILSLAKKTFTRNGNINTHSFHDVGAANTTLLLQAVNEGILGHMMGGYDKDKTIQTFNIEDDLEPVCYIALGYPDEPHKLDQPFRDREIGKRSRKKIDEIVTKL